MLWLISIAGASPTVSEVWCQVVDQPLADRADPWLAGTRTKAFAVSHEGVRTDWVLGSEAGEQVLAPTFRYRGQSLEGWLDPVGEVHLYLGGKASVPLGLLGELVPGAQLILVAGTVGEVVVEPPSWILEHLVEGKARASVACEALTVTRDDDRAEAATTAALAGHNERWVEGETELRLHTGPDRRGSGVLRTRSLERSVFVGASEGPWTQVAVRSWPRGVIWRGWVRDLITEAPGGIGSGGGGSGEGVIGTKTRFVTATCGSDVQLLVVGDERVEVGQHEAGGALVLKEDRGDTAEVLLHDGWARPTEGWHFEATGLADCARGEIHL